MLPVKPRKRKVRKGFLMDLILVLVLTTAPIWCAVLVYRNPFTTPAGQILSMPFLMIGALGLLWDVYCIASRLVGEKWW